MRLNDWLTLLGFCKRWTEVGVNLPPLSSDTGLSLISCQVENPFSQTQVFISKMSFVLLVFSGCYADFRCEKETAGVRSYAYLKHVNTR